MWFSSVCVSVNALQGNVSFVRAVRGTDKVSLTAIYHQENHTTVHWMAGVMDSLHSSRFCVCVLALHVGDMKFEWITGII